MGCIDREFMAWLHSAAGHFAGVRHWRFGALIFAGAPELLANVQSACIDIDMIRHTESANALFAAADLQN
jgi:hypothetical protein